MNPLRGNFKHDKNSKAVGVLCVACGREEEVNSHVMTCSHYQDLRAGKDLSKNTELVQFFREVMTRREEILKGSLYEKDHVWLQFGKTWRLNRWLGYAQVICNIFL